MSPAALQDPPRPLSARASGRGGPPPTSTRRSIPSEKNPSDSPSADQNGKVALSVPGSGTGETDENRRIHRREMPSSPVATNPSASPSGDRANCGVVTEPAVS